MPDQIDPLVGAEEPAEAYIPWAELMKRVHKIDVLKCPCGGRRRFVGYVTKPDKIREGLEELGLSCEAPKIAKPVPSQSVEGARGPAQEEIFDRTPDSDGVDPPSPDYAA